MKKTKIEKGITLIALILTIIILVILAVVALNAVNDGNIIQHAQDAQSEYIVAQEKEEVLLAQSEWNLQKYYPTNAQNFKDFIDSKFADDYAQVTGEANGPVTVTYIATGNAYTVTEGGEITSNGNPSEPTEPEVISIAGAYGDEPSGDYYVFNEDGTGKYNKNTDLTYNVVQETNGKITGTYTIDEQSEVPFLFEEKKDGDETNKIIYHIPMTEGELTFYGQALTTNGLVGFNDSDRMDESITYQAIDSGSITQIKFSNGSLISVKEDGTETVEAINHFILDNIIYVEVEGVSNLYGPHFAIWKQADGSVKIQKLWS